MSEVSSATLGEALRDAGRRIGRLDARLLLEQVCACSHARLIAEAERPLTSAEDAAYADLVARRAAGEPLAYLLGSADFYGLEFNVSPAVLIPRPDTEALVDRVLARAESKVRPRIVDLGTGSGIVAIMLALRCPQALVTAVDLSAAALAVAAQNARRHGAAVRFLHGDWYAPLGDERFDIVASNPPYVVAGDPHLQENGLPYEPAGALSDGVAGGDGLACIRALVAGAPRHLLPGGQLLIEHGYDQAVQVRELLTVSGFSEVASWRDGAGIERVSGGRLP